VFSYHVYLALDDGLATLGKQSTGRVSVTEFFDVVSQRTRQDAAKLKDETGKPAIQTPQITPSKERLRDLYLLSRSPEKASEPGKNP
jgi:hypothetical protein